MGRGVSSASFSEDVGDDGSDATESASELVGRSMGVLGGCVGNVWYRYVEPRRMMGGDGIGAPAWYEPEEPVRSIGRGRDEAVALSLAILFVCRTYMRNRCCSCFVCLCRKVMGVSVRGPSHDGVFVRASSSGAIKDVVNCKLVRQGHNWQLRHEKTCFVLCGDNLNSGSLRSRTRKKARKSSWNWSW